MRPSRRTTTFTKIWSYFRSEVSLNLGSQVNVRNASNDVRNASTTSQIAYLFDGKSTRFYKPKFYLPSTYNTPSILLLQNQQLRCDSCLIQITITTYNPDTIWCFPCRSATSKITSTVCPRRQCSPFPSTAFASYEYHINKVYILVPPSSALLPALQ